MGIYNILYLHEAAQLGGAENSLFNLLKKIDRTVFSPIFACPGKGLFPDKLTKLGVKVYPVTFFPLRKIIGVRSVINEIRRIIRDERIDLIHSNSIRTHLYAAIAGKMEKKPVIWHERNLIDKELIDPDSLFSFLPDKIICNSRAIAGRFLKKDKLPEKISVIHNGVDIVEFNPLVTGGEIRKEFKIKPERSVIGIVSRFNRCKGHETFFRAAKIIANNGSDCVFLVGGSAVFEEDRDREKYLQDMVKCLGIDDRVIFTGFMEDMPKIYAAMDMLVLASEAESCGRVILEAMASGKPVIGTDTGGTPEIVLNGVTGLLISPKDPSVMAKAMADLLKDQSLARRMGKAGRERVERLFNIEGNVARIQNTYLKLLEER